MSYTKGKWTARKQEENNPDSWEYDVVCQREAGMYPSTIARDINEANAQLIASAPDLYEALKDLVEAEWMVTHDWGGDRKAILKQVEKALAKAKGMPDSQDEQELDERRLDALLSKGK